MCFAAPVVTLALGLASAGAQFAASQADYQARSEQYAQNQINALSAARDEQKSLTNRYLQEQDAASAKVHQTNIEEARAKAEVAVNATAGGVSGISVDNLVGDIGRQAQTNRVTALKNWQATAAQLTDEMKATNTRAENRINSVSRPTNSSGVGLIAGVGNAFTNFARASGPTFTL